MSRFALVAVMAGLLGSAQVQAADFYPQPELRFDVPPPAPRTMPSPYGMVEREPLGIIMLSALWSEVRKSATVEEVVARVQGRFGPLPLVFTGTYGRYNVPTRVEVSAIYRRPGDDILDLPAVTFDVTHSQDGGRTVTRQLTIPLYPLTSSAYR